MQKYFLRKLIIIAALSQVVPDANTVINIDAFTYTQGFEKFAEMLRRGQRPLSLDKLVAPTILLTAIVESLDTGSEVFLDKYTK